MEENPLHLLQSGGILVVLAQVDLLGRLEELACEREELLGRGVLELGIDPRP